VLKMRGGDSGSRICLLIRLLLLFYELFVMIK
jgi:hypothetical protein